MTGNVREWCWDLYQEDYYKVSDNTTNPTGPSRGEYRVIRGGAWDIDLKNCRNSARAARRPTERDKNIGFRLVRN